MSSTSGPRARTHPGSIGGAFAAVGVAVSLMAVVPPAVRAQWVEPPGRGWADLSVYHQDTREVFESNGESRPFFSDGHAVSTSIFLTVAGGLAPGLDAWIQVPYHRLNYDDILADRLRTGIGDTRFFLRTAPLQFLGSEFPFAIRGGVKVPVGDFEVDVESIPLGDGQRDWELMAEIGRSFYPTAAYASGWIGYRLREENDETFRDFGDEMFFAARGAIGSGRWSVDLLAEGVVTVTQPTVAGLPFDNLERRAFTLHPSLLVAMGPGTAKLGARFTLAGRNLPAGTALVAGYFTPWAF